VVMTEIGQRFGVLPVERKRVLIAAR
jgi:hypothetical protein